MIGYVLQVVVIVLSMTSTYFFSRKGKERWGYLINFLSIPFWAATEWYYKEWIWLPVNLYYVVTIYIGLKAHWKYENKQEIRTAD